MTYLLKRSFVFTLLLVSAVSMNVAQRRMPTFQQYRAPVQKIRNIRVDLASNKDARMFRTNLRNAAKEGVNFAGHFVLATWGCGTNCSQTGIVDARNGRVFFPKELAGAGFGFCDLPDDAEALAYRADSRLLLLNGFKGGELDDPKSRCGVYYLEWTGARFRQVAFDRKKRLEMP